MAEVEVRVAVPHGVVDAAARGYLEDKVRRALRSAPAPVLYARAFLDVTANAAVERPVEARAAADVNGQVIRAHVVATTPREAADLLEEKLRHEIEHVRSGRLARRHRPATDTGQWRHGDVPTERPDHYPRDPSEREVVARQTWTRTPMAVIDAVMDMELLGHEFQLFSEIETGADAVVARRPEDGLAVLVAGERAPTQGLVDGADLTVGVPAMAVDDAVRMLDDGALPFVFFADVATGRGALVHRRYDGHVGLVTPAAATV